MGLNSKASYLSEGDYRLPLGGRIDESAEDQDDSMEFVSTPRRILRGGSFHGRSSFAFCLP